MAVQYRLKQFKTPNNVCNNKYYAHAVMVGEMDLYDIAAAIQRNCSMTKGDVIAVLTELVDVITDGLQSSKKIHLNGFGTFKMAVRGPVVDNKEDYNAQKIRGYHINFTPEYHFDNRKRKHATLIAGAKVVPYNSRQSATKK